PAPAAARAAAARRLGGRLRRGLGLGGRLRHGLGVGGLGGRGGRGGRLQRGLGALHERGLVDAGAEPDSVAGAVELGLLRLAVDPHRALGDELIERPPPFLVGAVAGAARGREPDQRAGDDALRQDRRAVAQLDQRRGGLGQLEQRRRRLGGGCRWRRWRRRFGGGRRRGGRRRRRTGAGLGRRDPLHLALVGDLDDAGALCGAEQIAELPEAVLALVEAGDLGDQVVLEVRRAQARSAGRDALAQ